MRRLCQVLSGALLVLGILSVLLTWLGIWQAHRREVDRLRLVWGQDVAVPVFNPVRLFDPSAIPLEVSGGYGQRGGSGRLIPRGLRRARRLLNPVNGAVQIHSRG
jgi:hypothetical protein